MLNNKTKIATNIIELLENTGLTMDQSLELLMNLCRSGVGSLCDQPASVLVFSTKTGEILAGDDNQLSDQTINAMLTHKLAEYAIPQHLNS